MEPELVARLDFFVSLLTSLTDERKIPWKGPASDFFGDKFYRFDGSIVSVLVRDRQHYKADLKMEMLIMGPSKEEQTNIIREISGDKVNILLVSIKRFLGIDLDFSHTGLPYYSVQSSSGYTDTTYTEMIKRLRVDLVDRTIEGLENSS